MQTLKDLKARAKFYKKGSIVPRNIVRVSPKKLQHLLTFGIDSWALPGQDNWVVFSEWVEDKDCCMKLSRTDRPVSIDGRHTNFCGNLRLNEIQHVFSIELALRRETSDPEYTYDSV